MQRPPLTINAWLRYDLVARLLAGLDDVESVLEVGAGQGAFGVRLAERYRYVGLEPDPRSFARALDRFQRAGVGTVVCGDLDQLAGASTFDLVCAFEVLEHFEDDVAALRSWRACLRTGGWLIASVPAFERQFGPWDRKAGHHRRYERSGLAVVLREAGFEPVSIETYGFPLGSVLEAARNVVARLGQAQGSAAERTAASAGLLQPPEKLGWLTQALSAPGRALQRPFCATERGTGLVVLARERGMVGPAH